MFKSIILQVSVLLALTSACAGKDGDSSKVQLATLAPEEQQPVVYQTIGQAVSSFHYSKPRINDAFSSKVFDNYLKHIDPNRCYFLQSDIDNFEKYRYSFDDAVFSGDIAPAFDIFNLYQQRLNDRIDYALGLLKTDFNYTQQDSFQIDRENAKWCKDYAELDQLWRRKVKYECLSIRATGKTFDSYSETIRKRYDNLRKIVSKTKSEDVFQVFVNAMLELADPHTNYFSPRSAEDFNTSMSLSLEGIGAQLQTDNEYIKIHEIIKGGPADKSKKLFAGDKIIGVSQGRDSEMVSVIDWRIDDAVALIRGKKGTMVRLEIIPTSEPNKTRIIELVRDKIVLEEQAAKSSVKEVERNGKKIKIGVISIPTFYIDFAAAQRRDPNYKSTTRDVKKLITELKKQKIEGLIIDLRNNGGGSLQEAVELTGLFIKRGPVVQVKDADGRVKAEDDDDNEIFYDGPLEVLVNRFSASASEIFSGAIQDYGRGLVIGERTYGKGTVQNMVDLNNFIRGGKKVGQVKLTIAKFYRVTGSSTQHKGVIPDIEFPGIFSASKYGEDASPYALPWDQIDATPFEATHRVDDKKIMFVAKHTERMKTEPEYKYLQEDIATVTKEEERQYVTLNEAAYKANLDKQDAQKKQREEQRKKARKDEGKSTPDLIMEDAEESIADMLTAK